MFSLRGSRQDPGRVIPPALCRRDRQGKPQRPHIQPVGIRISWSWSLTPLCPCPSTGPPEMGSTSFQTPIESQRFNDLWLTLGLWCHWCCGRFDPSWIDGLVDIPNPLVDQWFQSRWMWNPDSCNIPIYPHLRTNPYQETSTFASKIWIDYFLYCGRMMNHPLSKYHISNISTWLYLSLTKHTVQNLLRTSLSNLSPLNGWGELVYCGQRHTYRHHCWVPMFAGCLPHMKGQLPQIEQCPK